MRSPIDFETDDAESPAAEGGALTGILATGASVLAATGMRKALKSGYRKTRGAEPPTEAHRYAWRDAVLWSAAAGAVVGIVRMVARSGALAATRRARRSN